MTIASGNDERMAQCMQISNLLVQKQEDCFERTESPPSRSMSDNASIHIATGMIHHQLCPRINTAIGVNDLAISR